MKLVKLVKLVKLSMTKLTHIIQNIRGASLKEKVTFTRSLALIVRAGMALPQGLEVLARQSGSALLRRTLGEIKDAVTKGEAFSEVLRKYPAIFSAFYISMVKTGELSGNLEKVLGELALQMEKERALRSRVFGALMYPSVIFVVMLAVITLMMIVVVPHLAKVFTEFNATLPAPTRIVIAISGIVTGYAPLAAGAVLIFVFAFWYAISKTVSGKHTFDWVIMHLPLVGGLSKKINAARISRSLQTLVSSGIPITEGLITTSEVVKNSLYRNALVRASKQVEAGKELSGILSESKSLFTPLMIELISIGEGTGTMDIILGNLAESYEDEVERITKNLPALIEPILMIFIGASVGFLAVAMLQPIYTLSNSINY